MDASRVSAISPALVATGIAVGIVAVSTSAILIRLADAPALAVAFWRCALGAAALAPFAWAAQRRAPRLDAAQRRQLVGAGLLLALHFALFISSLDYTTVASSVLLVTMSPLFVGLGATLFLGEPPSRRVWRGLGAAAAGAIIVGLGNLAAGELGGRGLLGDAMAFAGAAAVAGYLLIGRAARQRLPVSVYAATVYAVAAVALLAACLATGASLGIGEDAYDTGTWLAIAALVVGPQLLGHTVFNSLLSTVSATVVAVAVLAEPVGAGALAYLVLGETPHWLFAVGAPLVFAGVWLASTRPRKGAKAPPPVH